MSKSDYLEAKFLDHALRNIAYTPPAAHYVALFTSAPQDDGSGTEVNGNGYARKQATFSRTGNVASNNADVVFDTATGGGWGTIVGAAVYDAPTGGNMLFHGLVTPNKAVNEGDAPVYRVGQLTFTEN